VARAALVLLHRQMQLRVLLEVAVGGEGLAAHRAQVLADRPVGVHVVGEAVLLVETLRTDRAVECRLVEVPAPVDVEEGPRLEGFAAQIADVGPLVSHTSHWVQLIFIFRRSRNLLCCNNLMKSN